MKPVKTKAQIRSEIDSQIDDYLAKGGSVAQCRPGESGRQDNTPLSKVPRLDSNEQTRTPVLSEVLAIEARRQKPKLAKKSGKTGTREKKALVTDDFGEPLRWITK